MTVAVELVNPFIVAAAEVLRTETASEVRRGALALERSNITAMEVTTLLSLVGDVEGMVMLSMSSGTAVAIVSRMMGEEFPELDELVQSGIGELGNVISGRAVTKLSAAGYTTDISVPTLIIGRGATVSTLDLQRLVVPLEADFGLIQLHLALREKRNGHSG
ncbi:MAG: chemotaxis protein CheX [Anaerolineae bacterium]